MDDYETQSPVETETDFAEKDQRPDQKRLSPIGVFFVFLYLNSFPCIIFAHKS